MEKNNSNNKSMTSGIFAGIDSPILTRTSGKWELKGLKIEVHGRGIIAIIPTVSNGGVSELYTNAEFICKAVNSYDSLLEALKSISDYADSVNSKSDLYENNIIKKVKEAISKAENK